METKTIQIDYNDDSVSIDYFIGERLIGKRVTLKPIPKRFRVLLEKFPEDKSKPSDMKLKSDPKVTVSESKVSEAELDSKQDKLKIDPVNEGGTNG